MLVAAIHAVATVTFRVDQIVSGVAINILALGVPRFLSIVAFGEGQEAQSPAVRSLPKIDLPRLGEISPVVPLTIVLGVAAWWVFNRTVLGLRLRSAGENPRAAESLGVRVVNMRYAGVLISGAFAGLAGGYLSVELVGQYTEGMNQGRGFIALAALILGNWSVIGVAFSCLLFAWTEALTVYLRVDWINNAFIASLPYIVTLVVLAVFSAGCAPPRPSARPTRPVPRSEARPRGAACKVVRACVLGLCAAMGRMSGFGTCPTRCTGRSGRGRARPARRCSTTCSPR